MKLATWNVNSLKVRLGHLSDWLKANPVEVVCLQETKLPDERFPKAEIEALGYDVWFSGQPAYNGVALLVRRDASLPVSKVQTGNPLHQDEQKRLISADIAGIRVICAYFPNGQEVGSDKYRYKLGWIDGLHQWLLQRQPDEPPLVLCGDFNIAPGDDDVHDPKLWAGQVLCSEPERERFRALLALGLVDSFRRFEQPPRLFSWWDYRQLGFRRNAGLRIDHILVADQLAARLKSCRIDKEPRRLEKPSDHAPVVAELDL